MAVTRRDVEELVSWARLTSRRVRVRFRGYRYMVVIGRYVEAADLSGRTVPWATAFGSRAPHDVLSSLPVEEVVVEEGGSTRSFTSVEELLAYAGIRRSSLARG
jgi:hypothetical protein